MCTVVNPLDDGENRFVPQPTAACGLIEPKSIIENTFVSASSEDFQKAHLLTCKFCQEKVEKFRKALQN